VHAVRLEPPPAAVPPTRDRRVARARLVAVGARTRPAGYARRRPSWPAIAFIVAVHAILIAAFVARTDPLRISKPPSAIVVSLVTPQEPPKPPPPPKPRPMPAKAIAPMPVVAPPPVVVPEVPRMQELPAITLPPSPPDPVPSPAVSAPVAPVAAAPAIAPLVPPRFDAAYLDNPAPIYPAIARRQGEQGRVLLRVSVAADGRAASVEIAASSGSERLDRAALDAVRRWRFVPARRGDEAVAAQVLVPVAFSLDRA